jgi:hypothetical protein
LGSRLGGLFLPGRGVINQFLIYALFWPFMPCYTHTMKLSDWAEQQGITYKTAWRWFKAGCLPVPATQMPTGTVIVHVESFSSVLTFALRLPAEDRQRLIRELEKSL